MKKIILIVFVCIMSNSYAQQRPEAGAWFTVNLPVNFSDHWQWHNDAGYRTFDLTTRPLQYLYRTGLRYIVNKEWSLASGVAFFFTKSDFDKSHHEFGQEIRFWQEGLYQPAVDEKLKLIFRLRTEQRFFHATSIKESYTGYRYRFRPGLNYQLNDQWSLQLTNEYMHQAVNHQFSFDQNRVQFTGIFHLNISTQVQGGYMWLKWPDADQHIFQFTFLSNLHVKKSRK